MTWLSGTNLELDRERSPVSLVKEFAKKGGEASVWSVSRAGWLAKIYHRQPDANKVAKLKYMVANPPDDPERANGHCSIAWPSQLLLDPRHSSRPVVGFLMPQAPPSQELVVAFEFLHRIKWAPEFGWSALMLATVNLATAFESVHRKGYVIGDISEKNVLITREARVTLIDNDSFQVFDSRNKVLYRRGGFRDLYQAPEMQGKEPKGYALCEVQDRFGLGVLIHQLLFCGRHPFNGVWQLDDDPPEYSELIKGHHYIYRTDSLMKPVAGWPGVTDLPIQVQELFWRCFDRGHREPHQRPSAQEWRNELWKCLRELRQCSRYPKEHQYHPSNATCPWCDRLQMMDWFGAGRPDSALNRATQIPLSALPNLSAGPVPSSGVPVGAVPNRVLGGISTKQKIRVRNGAIALLLVSIWVGLFLTHARFESLRRRAEMTNELPVQPHSAINVLQKDVKPYLAQQDIPTNANARIDSTNIVAVGMPQNTNQQELAKLLARYSLPYKPDLSVENSTQEQASAIGNSGSSTQEQAPVIGNSGIKWSPHQVSNPFHVPPRRRDFWNLLQTRERDSSRSYRRQIDYHNDGPLAQMYGWVNYATGVAKFNWEQNSVGPEGFINRTEFKEAILSKFNAPPYEAIPGERYNVFSREAGELYESYRYRERRHPGVMICRQGFADESELQLLLESADWFSGDRGVGVPTAGVGQLPMLLVEQLKAIYIKTDNNPSLQISIRKELEHRLSGRGVEQVIATTHSPPENHPKHYPFPDLFYYRCPWGCK